MGVGTGIFIGVVTVLVIRWLLRPSNAPSRQRGGVTTLAHGGRFRALLWGVLALFLGDGVYAYLTYDGEFPQLRAIRLQSAVVLSVLVCAPMALYLFRSWVRFDGQSVTFGRVLRPPVTVPWGEIRSARWREPSGALVVQWAGGSHEVVPWLDGIGEFVAALRTRGIAVPPASWERS